MRVGLGERQEAMSGRKWKEKDMMFKEREG